MPEEHGGVVQYLIHPALRPALDGWLASRGLGAYRLPADVEGEDNLPTFLISPTQETMNRVRQSHRRR